MFSLAKVAALLGVLTPKDLVVCQFEIDSRRIGHGGLFFALCGNRVCGEDFLSEVACNGGVAAIVSNDYCGLDYGLVLLKVDNVIESLHRLAKAVLLERRTRIIGVTGSVGKTTIKEFIYHLISQKYNVYKNPMSFNSQVTLPIVILNAKGDEDFIVLEMAMSKKGDISRLIDIAPPDIVVLGQITYCHAENFSNLEGIAASKSEIFNKKVKFSVIHEESAKFDVVLKACKSDRVVYPSSFPIKLPFHETHFVENFSAAYEVAKYLGVKDKEIECMVDSFKMNDHRFQKKQINGVTFIDDAYNANPASSIAAFKNLPKPSKNCKKIAVFGAMGELGKFSLESHRIVGEVAVQEIDELLCIGDECDVMVDIFCKHGKFARKFKGYDELKNAMNNSACNGDVVLLKGSNYHKLWEFLQ